MAWLSRSLLDEADQLDFNAASKSLIDGFRERSAALLAPPAPAAEPEPLVRSSRTAYADPDPERAAEAFSFRDLNDELTAGWREPEPTAVGPSPHAGSPSAQPERNVIDDAWQSVRNVGQGVADAAATSFTAMLPGLTAGYRDEPTEPTETVESPTGGPLGPRPTPGEAGGDPLADGPTWQPTAASAAAPTDGMTPGEYVRWAAQQRGIDPNIAAKVMGAEGGGTEWNRVGRFNTGQSHGPLQLHYAGGSKPAAGMGDDFTKITGIDLRTEAGNDPRNQQAAIDFALDRVSKTGDWREWYGADPALGSRFSKAGLEGAKALGIGAGRTPAAPSAGPTVTQPMAAREALPSPTLEGGDMPLPTAQARQQAPRQFAAGDLTPNQYEAGKAAGLSDEAAWAVCGPAAAIAFARANNRNPAMGEAVELAKSVGWTAQQGMAGPDSQVALLKKMNIAATKRATDWDAVQADIARGNPVQFSSAGGPSGGHYFVAERYDPETKKYDFGQSTSILKAAKGQRWFTAAEAGALGFGALSTAIHMDNPASPSPSVVAGRSPERAEQEWQSLKAPAEDEADVSPPGGLEPAPTSYAPAEADVFKPPASQIRNTAPDVSPDPEIPRTYGGGAPSDDGDGGPMIPSTRTPAPPAVVPEGGDAPLYRAPVDPSLAAPIIDGEVVVPPGSPYEQPAPATSAWDSITQSPVGQAVGGFAQQVVDEGSIVQPIARPIGNAIRAATGRDPLTEEEAVARGISGPTTIERAVARTGRDLREGAEALATGYEQGDYGQAALGALGVAGNLAPSTTVANALSELFPRAEGNVAGIDVSIGAGDAVSVADAANQGARLLAKAAQLGYRGFRSVQEMAPRVVEAVGRGIPADRFDALPEGAMQLGSGVVPERLAADARNAAQGGVFGAATTDLTTPEGEETDPGERLRNTLAAGALATVAGRRAGAVGRQLGSGVVARAADEPRGMLTRATGPEGARPITETADEAIKRIRLDKFPEELRPAIQQAAEDVGFGATQRRGVVPDQTVQDAADEIGTTVDQWIKRGRAGRAYNPEETAALRNVVTGQAQTVRQITDEIAEAEKAGVVTDILIVRAHQEGEKLASLVNVMEGARAEAGRSLRAWRAEGRPTDPSDAAQRIFHKFGGGPEGRERAIQAIKEFNEIPPDDVISRANFWARVERGGTISNADILTSIRYNSMLSSPRTWEVGWIGSLFQAVPKGVSDVMAATSRPLSGELGEAAKGAAVGLARGLRPLWETIAHGITSEQAMGGQLPRGLGPRAESTVGRVVGTAIDLPGRLVAAPDALFSSMFGQAETGRQAAIAAFKRDLKGDDRAQFMADFMANPPKETADEVQRVVDGLMLRGDMGSIGTFINSIGKGTENGDLIRSFVMPFMKVSYHVWTQGMELTPLGTIGTAVDVARGVYRDGRPSHLRPLAERARYNAMGLGITGGALMYAADGKISGIGPDDPEKRDQLRAQGWQPYSVRVADSWVSYANWGPVAVPLALAAAHAENQQYRKPGTKPEAAVFDMAKRVASLTTEQTFLQGIGTVMNAFEDPQRYTPQFLSSQLTSTIPFGSLLNTVGQSMDDTMRRPDRASKVGLGQNIAQGIEARIPPNPLTPDRTDVPAALDPLGRPVPNQQQGAMAYQPFRVSPDRPDPTLSAFQSAQVDIGKPKDELTIDGIKIELTPEEQRQWQRLRGEVLERATPKVAAGAGYQRAPLDAKQKALQGVLRDAGEAADGQLIRAIGADSIRQRVREAAAQKRAASQR